jgi:signal peptidase I
LIPASQKDYLAVPFNFPRFFANSQAARKKPKPQEGSWSETGRTVLYAGLIALGIRTLAFEPFNIPSGSMIPTLLVGDYLFVSKFSYGYSKHSFPFSLAPFKGRIFKGEPERGDVVVFKLPTDNKTDYIKRLVGLPGDRIQVKGGILHINGEPVKRERIADYVFKNEHGSTERRVQYLETLPGGRVHPIIEISDVQLQDDTQEYLVPDNHYFAMGDNRDSSKDSRYLYDVGYVPSENLVGRAEFLWFSTDGSANLFEFWKWPTATRFSRFFGAVR